MKKNLLRQGLLLMGVLLALSGCGAAKDVAATEAPTQVAEAQAAEGLTIPLSDLTDEPQFFDWDSNGTAMQLIALKDADGSVQLAYNTCQVCAGSPYAYFEVENGRLICQNCGNAFPYSSVGKVAGGCNPMPVSEYAVTADGVIVTAQLLAQNANAFQNWKGLE
ncbi:MAG: Fe-S-containing protein [Clostridia bacterium]|nr:Fe-S-containing protein [Clostridia bacterium]MDO4356204.1 Fe-S-containing protein [Clostridia bacterium]